MTDEPAPTAPLGDFFEQVADAAETTLPKALQKLKDAVDTGGVRTVRIRCDKCGAQNSETVEIADIEEIRKIVEMFASVQLRANAQRKADTTGKRASTILREIRDMTDDEVAEAIAALEEGEDSAES